MTKTFTLTHEQYCALMSALQHAIDVYQDTRQPKTEAAATAVQDELRRQANDSDFQRAAGNLLNGWLAQFRGVKHS